MLERLIVLVNKTGISFHIMLQVRGLAVYGELITAQGYWETQSEHIAKYEAPDPGAAAAKDGLAKAFAALAGSVADALKQGHGAAAHIHLRDALIIVPGERIEVPLWRGRLSSVDAFVIGRRGPDED